MKKKTKYLEEALELCKKENFFGRLSKYGKPIFLVISGAHNFGFPSEDSDYDIRGVYYEPSKNLLDVKPSTRKVFNTMSEDRKLDVSIDELRHYLHLVSNSNGNRIEWPFSDFIFYQSSEFPELKQVVKKYGVSKDLFHNYLNFARDMWKGETKKEGVKKDLYTLRVYMTGITVLEDNKICSDINELNKKFKEPIVNKMLKVKAKGENNPSTGYDRDELEEVVKKLDSRLTNAYNNSNLKEHPNLDKINRYHQKIRIRELCLK